MGLASELKRRNVFRMAVLYIVATWLVMQVAEVIIALANLPGWIGLAVLGLLAVGFPIALVFSWFYELTPEGLTLEKDVAPGASITHLTGRRIDLIIISLLSAAVLLFAWHTWWPSVPKDKSIAVMAFENMSDDPEQEYFSDGISEELLNTLAHVPELRVISRSSSFSFKGKDVDIPAVAKQMNVTHVLEGSVRKMGNRVRITVQLIEASTDSHLWSNTYDRDLDDIFAIQEEIAAEVVTQLEHTLFRGPPIVHETDTETFTLYLQGLHIFRQSTTDGYKTALDLYERAVALDPTYAPAWREIAVTYANLAFTGVLPMEEGFAKGRTAVQTALELDPLYAPAHSTRGWIAMTVDRDYRSAAQSFARARELAPWDSAVLSNSSILATTLGQLDEAIELSKRAIELDPVDPVVFVNLADQMMRAGRFDEAVAASEKALQLSPGDSFAQGNLALTRVLQRRPLEAQDIASQIEVEAFRLLILPMAYHDLGQSEQSDAALMKFKEKFDTSFAFYIAGIHAWRGETSLAFDWLERAIEEGQDVFGIRTDPFLRGLHTDQRWDSVMMRSGLSDAQIHDLSF